jgi:hypothetical protein
MGEQQAGELAFMKKAVLWDKGNKVLLAKK